MIYPFWLFFKKRKPMPEYRSPNTWSDYMNKLRDTEVLFMELESSFTKEQKLKYYKYREAVQKAERAKPWQGEYAKLVPDLLIK